MDTSLRANSRSLLKHIVTPDLVQVLLGSCLTVECVHLLQILQARKIFAAVAHSTRCSLGTFSLLPQAVHSDASASCQCALVH